MRVLQHQILAAVVASACVAACAGNGDGLNQNGEPISLDGGSGGSITADFDSIQDNVFTPICSKCHIGASAPEGLELDAAHSYALLVDVPSVEEPSLKRVDPGDPDDSYMVRKIEGLAGIEGGQMPLGEPPLAQATIDAIRQWITNGAPMGSSAGDAAQFAVALAVPRDSTMARAPLARVVVGFTAAVDATLLNGTTVSLQRADDAAEPIPAELTLATHNPRVLIIRPLLPLAVGAYRVTLRGSGGGALADQSARTLGADVSWQFSVAAAP
jgi:hypothetical protein